MADTNNVSPKTTTISTSANLSSKEGYAVTVAGALATDSSTPVFPLNTGADGSSTATNVSVTYAGTQYFKTGGSVTAGDKLTATTNSVWITTTTDTQNYGGIALEDADSGDMIKGIVVQGMIAG